MTAALKLVPLWVWAALGLLTSIGYLAWRLDSVKADRVAVTLERDTAQAKAASLADTLRLQRQLTQDIDQVADDAKANADHVTAAVAVAADRADSLQQQITSLLAARKSCPAPATAGGKSRDDLATVLADLRRSADERAGSLAEALDRSRIAGLACEAAYSAAQHR
jgi:septal ring factor EnvC (AmiA/AmiB activator)